VNEKFAYIKFDLVLLLTKNTIKSRAMKRADHKRINELDKNLNILLKECPKVFKQPKVKKIDYKLWIINEGMFYCITPIVWLREDDLKSMMRIEFKYKPLWMDDLLWEILGMESYMKGPKSLRANDCYTGLSMDGGERIIELSAEDIDYVRNVLHEEINGILAKLNDFNEKKYLTEFEKYVSSRSEYACDAILVAIHENFDEKQIVTMINSCDNYGRFCFFTDKSQGMITYKNIGVITYKHLIIKYLREKKNYSISIDSNSVNQQE